MKTKTDGMDRASHSTGSYLHRSSELHQSVRPQTTQPTVLGKYATIYDPAPSITGSVVTLLLFVGILVTLMAPTVVLAVATVVVGGYATGKLIRRYRPRPEIVMPGTGRSLRITTEDGSQEEWAIRIAVEHRS